MRKWENEIFIHAWACIRGKIVIPTNLQIPFFCAKFAAGKHDLHKTAELNAVIVRSDGGGKRQWWRRTATVSWANGTTRWCHLTQTWFRSVNFIVKQSIKKGGQKSSARSAKRRLQRHASHAATVTAIYHLSFLSFIISSEQYLNSVSIPNPAEER